MRRVSLLAVGVVLVAAAWASGQSLPGGAGGAGIPQPPLLRLIGFVGSAPAGMKTLGPITLGIDRSVKTLDLTEVQMLNGPLTEGRAALRQSELYNPNLELIGDRGLLRRISAAADHTKLTLFGYLRSSGRRLLVVQVNAS